ncbi:MAG TPA: hypothetical protein VFL85_05200 [Candidatus Saccharimonadales bacterium]|nr:hypothetical protein [Candidatus Saccharimonadales bacterium]
MALMTICEAGGQCPRINDAFARELGGESIADRKSYCAKLVSGLIETDREAFVAEADCGYEAQFIASQTALKAHLKEAQNA